ncbi:TlpA family protein disulfide reductase [Gemmatimonas phototrophica]|uniref:TlpA family protein disulfide reductase n=1 Tax=Gemmatimonas phototrophica TaxID=1379270 RepID=UPI00047D2D57|nr:TlpA disulfide reductase family protein [Gemmatimonas phototrophica]
MSFSRTLKHTAAAVAVALALPVVGVQQVQAQVGGIAVGSMAPTAMTVPTLDNTSFDFAGVVGKQPVVMEFWATWCPLCRKLEPAMEAAKAKYGNRISFIHVGVPENQSAERQKAYVQQKGLKGMFLFDQDNKVSKAYQVPHTSFIVVLDAKGAVVYTGVGAEQDVDAAIRRALPNS